MTYSKYLINTRAVRITTARPETWYEGMLGQVIDVKEYSTDYYEVVFANVKTSAHYLIAKTDVEIA